MNFIERPPSTAWEPVTLPHTSDAVVWLWHKPENLPNGIAVQIPEATHAKTANTNVLNLRNILNAGEIDPAMVAHWFQYGLQNEGWGGMNPAFEQVIPPASHGVDPNIFVTMQTPVAPQPPVASAIPTPVAHPAVAYPAPVQPQQPATPQTVSASSEEIGATDLPEGASRDLVHSIDGDWRAILHMEKQMAATRKKMTSVQGRLNSLNRDLSPDERNYGDNQDRRDWQDARRWLRDAGTNLSRYLRDHDIGPTSTAGRRTWFEEMHKQLVVLKQPVPNLEEIHREFVNFRKAVQTLHNNMTNANNAASRDGEQRAKRVLSRISAKVRKAKTKRS